ncbi:helix-turn-helix domain-containing protein [Nocardioides sp. NPDC006273]|uniref:PucR family transcriptional regulator n=1 Tax=Nocardioides sp. NPDC006273 TaxID=3155598 RepID=UPI0033BD999B
MITAAGLAEALPRGFVEVVVAGESRPIFGLEITEVGEEAAAGRGELVTVVGATEAGQVLAIISACADASGLLVRRSLADDADVARRCAEAGLPLLGMVEGASLSSVLAVVRSAIETSSAPARGSADHLHDDLFDVADRISSLLDAPVTIEDASSHVLAYSRGQSDVDDARTATIVGRRVPREVRDHFRSLGVFRRMARSDAPFFVPAGAGGVKARYVVPVRAGGEWLGSIWAIPANPLAPGHERELEAATELVALSLLRLRAQAELHQQVQLDQVRSVVRGAATEQPEWLEDGPWRVAVLAGPADLQAEARCQLWQALCRRRGWRRPVVADLDDHVYAVLRDGASGPGADGWLADLVRGEGRTNAAVRMYVGTAVATPRELEDSRSTAAELAAAGGDGAPVVTVAEGWPSVVLTRAVHGQESRPFVSPLRELLDHDGATFLVDTLEAMIDFWGEPKRAARSLGVHPNTVRNRATRIVALCPIDLEDPQQRLGLRLEIARLRARDGREG